MTLYNRDYNVMLTILKHGGRRIAESAGYGVKKSNVLHCVFSISYGGGDK